MAVDNIEQNNVEKSLPKIYRIAVGAVGGQGGGAISEILFYAIRSERHRFAPDKAKLHTYETRGMIPGLAQRSGSTITSVTFLDPHLKESELPDDIILTEMPHRSSCDLVIGQELNELMKFLPLLRPDGVIIANEEKQITPPEKLPSFKENFSSEDQIKAAKQYVKDGNYYGFSSERLIEEYNLDPRTVNTFILGMVSQLGILNISRDSLIEALNRRFKGNIFEVNKTSFELGEMYIEQGLHKQIKSEEDWKDLTLDEISARSLNHSLKFVSSRKRVSWEKQVLESFTMIKHTFPENVSRYVIEGYSQLVNFQNPKYGNLYLEKTQSVFNADVSPYTVTENYARHMAGRFYQWDGPIRVAEYVKKDAQKESTDGTLRIETKKLQPTIEEIIGMVPVPYLVYNHIPRRIYNWYDRNKFRGRSTDLNINSIIGFGLFWFLDKLKPIRPWTVRYKREMNYIKRITETLIYWESKDSNVAQELSIYLSKVRGYSFVRHDHLTHMFKIMDHLDLIYEQQGKELTCQFIRECYLNISYSGKETEDLDGLIKRFEEGEPKFTLKTV